MIELIRKYIDEGYAIRFELGILGSTRITMFSEDRWYFIDLNCLHDGQLCEALEILKAKLEDVKKI